MKKFVLRVLAVLMVAAMMVPSMGNVTTALADEAVTLDLTQKGLIVGEAPTDNADGSVSFTGGVTMKATFPLPTTLAAGESVKVNATIKFNSADDAGVRFYLVNGVDVNIATEIATVANDGSGVVEATFTLTAASDATELLFASSGYGVYMNDITLVDITLGDKPAEAPAATGDLYDVNLAERVFVSGAAPADNADGSITVRPNIHALLIAVLIHVRHFQKTFLQIQLKAIWKKGLCIRNSSIARGISTIR